MVLKVNTAEGGTNGLALTEANIAAETAGASGDPFSLERTGGTATFTSTVKHRGNRAYQLTHAASQSQSLRWGGWGTAKTLSTRSYQYFPTIVAGQIHSVQSIWTSTYAAAATLNIDGEGRALLQNSAYATLYHPTAATFTFTTGQWYRIEMAVTIGATTTTGTASLAIYVGDATTPAVSFTSTTTNTGPAADTINSVYYGRSNKPAYAYDQYLDNLAATDVSTAELGPVAADTATEPPAPEATSARRANGADGGAHNTLLVDATAATQTGGFSGDGLGLSRTGGAVTFYNNPVHRGTLSYRLSYAAGESQALRWGGWGATQQLSTRAYHYLPTIAAANHGITAIYPSSYAGAVTAYIDAERRLLVQDVAGATVYHPSAATFTFTAATWYRVELAMAIGATTTTGTIRVAVYPGESNTPLVTQLVTTANTGAAANTIAEVNFGRTNKPAVAFDHFIDNLAAVSGTTAPVGYVSGTPVVTATGGRTGIEPGETVTLSGGDPATGTAARSWRQVSGTPTVGLTGADTATATFTAPATLAGAALVFGYRVLNTDAVASAEATVTHTVHPATERAVLGGVEVPVLTRAVQNGGLA